MNEGIEIKGVKIVSDDTVEVRVDGDTVTVTAKVRVEHHGQRSIDKK